MRWYLVMGGWAFVVVGVVAWLYVQVRKEDKDIEWNDRLREAEAFDYDEQPQPPRAA